MNNEFWLNKWENNDLTFHESQINPDLINFVDGLKLKPNDTVFVPLCGKTKDMIWLAEQGYKVVGVELSKIACIDFFKESDIIPTISSNGRFTKYTHGLIEIFCGDLFDLTSSDLRPIQAVYDCKAIVALPSSIRKKYINHILGLTGKDINLLVITRESRSIVIPPPYPIDENELNLLFGTEFKVKQVKQFTVPDIPERLIKKGYSDISECAYIITGTH